MLGENTPSYQMQSAVTGEPTTYGTGEIGKQYLDYSDQPALAGTGIEVKSPEDIQDLKCAVIIFAWRYQDAIKARISSAHKIEAITSIWSRA